jgi:hypothetical protein
LEVAPSTVALIMDPWKALKYILKTIKYVIYLLAPKGEALAALALQNANWHWHWHWHWH